MSGLFLPGEARAVGIFDGAALLRAMTAVETAWLQVLAAHGVTTADATVDLAPFVEAEDVAAVGAAAEASGNPVVPLLALLRDRLREAGLEAAAHWLHRGLTSQDTLDTALVLLARDTRTALQAPLRALVASLAELAERHRDDPMTGRTLTQPAVPIRFGSKAAGWLQGRARRGGRPRAAGPPRAGRWRGRDAVRGRRAGRQRRRDRPRRRPRRPARPHGDRTVAHRPRARDAPR